MKMPSFLQWAHFFSISSTMHRTLIWPFCIVPPSHHNISDNPLNLYDSHILHNTALDHFHHTFHLATKFVVFFLKGYDINNCLLYKLNVFYDFIFLGNEDIHYRDKNNGDFFFRNMRSFTFYVLIKFIVEVVNAPAVLVIEVPQEKIINHALIPCKSSHETSPKSKCTWQIFIHHVHYPYRSISVGHFLRTVHTCYPFLFSAPAFALVWFLPLYPLSTSGTILWYSRAGDVFNTAHRTIFRL